MISFEDTLAVETSQDFQPFVGIKGSKATANRVE